MCAKETTATLHRKLYSIQTYWYVMRAKQNNCTLHRKLYSIQTYWYLMCAKETTATLHRKLYSIQIYWYVMCSKQTTATLHRKLYSIQTSVMAWVGHREGEVYLAQKFDLSFCNIRLCYTSCGKCPVSNTWIWNAAVRLYPPMSPMDTYGLLWLETRKHYSVMKN
jgi:hypothetical protein